MAPETPVSLIKSRARALGFDEVGIAGLEPIPHAEQLDRWLAGGMAGNMAYMNRQAERRKHPDRIVPGATHVVVVTWNYYTPDPTPLPNTGRIARYARGRDYHAALQPPLEALRQYLIELGGTPERTRAYVDAGPVPERELAQRAGVGWIGKNTMLITPGRGSFFFLATVFTDLALQADEPVSSDHCGTCTRCLDACPTGAFAGARVLDATRCISYLTIEYRGATLSDQPDTGDWIFGCDVCQDVCPWNEKFARPAPAGAPLNLDAENGLVPLEEIAGLDQEAFDRRFGWTAMERTGLSGLQRNARAVARSKELPCSAP